MAETTTADAGRRAKMDRVLRALDQLLAGGEAFNPSFSGQLTLDLEIRSGGIQDLRLTRRERDRWA